MATAVHCARILTAGDGSPPFYFPPLSPSLPSPITYPICIMYILYSKGTYDLAHTALARGSFSPSKYRKSELIAVYTIYIEIHDAYEVYEYTALLPHAAEMHLLDFRRQRSNFF